MVLLSWHLSVVFYEYKSSQLIIKSDRYDLSYHCNFLMVFKATITIEWNGWGKPLMIDSFLMVFGSPTIVFDGFRWLSTNAIGQTMRCDGPSFQSFPKCWKAVLMTLWGAQISQSKNDLITIKFEEKKKYIPKPSEISGINRFMSCPWDKWYIFWDSFHQYFHILGSFYVQSCR